MDFFWTYADSSSSGIFPGKKCHRGIWNRLADSKEMVCEGACIGNFIKMKSPSNKKMYKTNSPWTSDDLEILWTLVRKGKCSKDIAVLLGRKEQDILIKARELGLKLKPEDDKGKRS